MYLSIYLSIHLSMYLSFFLSSYLSIHPSIHLSIYVSIYLFVYLSIYLSIHPSIHPSIYLSIYLSIFLSILSSYLSIYLSFCLSVFMFNCKLENEAILRDLLSFWTWQHQKRSNSARLPWFLNLTTSKTKQFCGTSSFFVVDNIKDPAILRDILQKWKVECRADNSLVPMRFAIVRLHLSKRLRVPRKSDTGSYEVLHLSRKIISANLKIWCSKMQPLSGNDFDMCFAPEQRALFRHLNSQKWFEHGAFCTCSLRNVLGATTACTFSTSQFPKVVRAWCVLCILTSKCASCYNGVQCALFRHLNFQKCSEREVFLAFSLANVLRATTACNFSFLIWPAGSTPAALASLLSDPRGPHIIGKTPCFATFLPFRAPGSSFFGDILFCDVLSSSLLLSYSAHLCFSSVHIVGSLTSKLPSNMDTIYICMYMYIFYVI